MIGASGLWGNIDMKSYFVGLALASLATSSSGAAELSARDQSVCPPTLAAANRLLTGRSNLFKTANSQVVITFENYPDARPSLLGVRALSVFRTVARSDGLIEQPSVYIRLPQRPFLEYEVALRKLGSAQTIHFDEARSGELSRIELHESVVESGAPDYRGDGIVHVMCEYER